MPERIVAFLPAKGFSDRVANKNMRAFNGEPFFCFMLRKLLACPVFDEVYIDSEDDNILRIGERLGARPLRRDPGLATNDTDGHALFFNEVRQVDANIYVQALCTAPFLSLDTITRAVSELRTRPYHDSVVLLRRDKAYDWIDGAPAYGDPIPNSTDLSWRESEAMSFYAVRGETAHRTRKRIGERPIRLHVDDPVELIDVNTPADFALAETVAAGTLARETRRLRFLAVFLSSSLLSDVCRDIGIEAVLPGAFACNVPGRKVFGRARTLDLRPAEPGDDPAGIYDALGSYDLLAGDDVIVVKGLNDLAYFGELNASLAVRSGAQAAVIDGATRDFEATSRIGFPVWARSTTCRDVKGRAVVATANEPVNIGGIPVDPSSLVFADCDGVVVLPRDREETVLARALEALSTERRVLGDVMRDVDVAELVTRHGFF
jgi:regulator of RNase E activity RraA/CMP-N-acetylneuraminic acid synthetase